MAGSGADQEHAKLLAQTGKTTGGGADLTLAATEDARDAAGDLAAIAALTEIATPASATAEDCANKVNEIIAALTEWATPGD